MIATSFPGFRDADGGPGRGDRVSGASSSPSTARRRRARGPSRRSLAQHYGLPVLDTGLLYRAVGVTLLRRRAATSDDEAAAAAAARAARSRQLGRSGLPHPRRRRGGEPGGGPSGGARTRCCDFQRAFAAPARRRGDRRARHRHRDRPRRAGQALRHRLRRGPRAPPLAAAEGHGSRPSTTTTCWPISSCRDARDAGRADSPMSPRRRRRLARHHRNDYRRRRRCGPPHRRGGARQVGAIPPANPTAPYPRPPRATYTKTPNAASVARQSNPTTFRACARPRIAADHRPFETKTEKEQQPMADDLSMNPTPRRLRGPARRQPSDAATSAKAGRQGQGRGDREGLRDHRRRPEDRRPHPGEGIRRRRRRQGDPEGRRHRRGVPRAGRERAGRGGDQPREGPPRGSLDPPGRRLRQERAGDGLHRRPREGRLHRRPRRRLGLPAGQPGRHPPGARRRPADGPRAAVRDPEDGPPARQHRRLAPRHPGGSPRRAAHRAGQPAAPRAKCAKAWSRTSPTTARSWTWAASTACCTSPT